MFDSSARCNDRSERHRRCRDVRRGAARSGWVPMNDRSENARRRGGARKPPTMADVASLAGVSTMTVSRALNPDSSVREETRERIREAAEQLLASLSN